jgi:hypothetical protein
MSVSTHTAQAVYSNYLIVALLVIVLLLVNPMVVVMDEFEDIEVDELASAEMVEVLFASSELTTANRPL